MLVTDCMHMLSKAPAHDRNKLALELQIMQQHIVPGKAFTEFSISNNQKLPTLLAGSPLTVRPST